MELRRLECFVAVARELHFRRAAESIPMAQSALSTQIKMLEAEVGVPLLNRTTRRVELTPAGEVYLEHAKTVLSGVKEASRAAARAHEGELGHIRVGFGGSATYEFVPRVARTFRAAFPQVRLELHSEMVTRPQTEALIKDQIDVGVLRPPVATPGLTVEVLRRERLVLAMPERHPDAGKAKIELASMADSDFIAYPGTLGASVYSVMINACNEAGFSPNVAQEASETHTVVSLVAAGLGVALVPDAVRFLRMPGVVYRELDGDATEIDLSIAWRTNDNRNALHRFVEVARELAAAPLQPDGD